MLNFNLIHCRMLARAHRIETETEPESSWAKRLSLRNFVAQNTHTHTHRTAVVRFPLRCRVDNFDGTRALTFVWHDKKRTRRMFAVRIRGTFCVNYLTVKACRITCACTRIHYVLCITQLKSPSVCVVCAYHPLERTPTKMRQT